MESEEARRELGLYTVGCIDGPNAFDSISFRNKLDREMRTKVKPVEKLFDKHENPINVDDNLKGLLEEFTQKTTISAVTLICNRISIFWKTILVLVVLFSLSMSIYQAVELIKNYLRYPSFLTEVEMLNTSFYIPAITLCNKNSVNWEKVKERNLSILYTIEKEATKLKETGDELNIRKTLNELLINELHAMKVDERKEILSNIDDWLMSYYGNDAENYWFNYEYNKSLHAFSYFPLYGNCITINPGFTEQSKLRLRKQNALMIVAEVKPEIEFPYLETSSGLLLSMHAPGSAPVLGWNKDMRILPGEYLHLGIQVIDIQRLPSPYSSKCIDESEEFSDEVRKISPYQSEETYYSYSREECLATCIWHFIQQEKECYVPEVAMNETHKLFKLCSFRNIYDALLKTDKKCSEECPKRCREFIYEWTPKLSLITGRSSFFMDFLNRFNKTITNISNAIIIELNVESNNYLYSKETAKYELEDIIGSIGGNLGLWIGFSILSAFELFELLTNIVILFLRKIMKYKRI